jgi:hypothetical protein
VTVDGHPSLLVVVEVVLEPVSSVTKKDTFIEIVPNFKEDQEEVVVVDLKFATSVEKRDTCLETALLEAMEGESSSHSHALSASLSSQYLMRRGVSECIEFFFEMMRKVLLN